MDLFFQIIYSTTITLSIIFGLSLSFRLFKGRKQPQRKGLNHLIGDKVNRLGFIFVILGLCISFCLPFIWQFFLTESQKSKVVKFLGEK